jgi:hypothetical protein
MAASLGATRSADNAELAHAHGQFLLTCRAMQVQAIDIVKVRDLRLWRLAGRTGCREGSDTEAHFTCWLPVAHVRVHAYASGASRCGLTGVLACKPVCMLYLLSASSVACMLPCAVVQCCMVHMWLVSIARAHVPALHARSCMCSALLVCVRMEALWAVTVWLSRLQLHMLLGILFVLF